MTATAGHTADRSLPRHALEGLGRPLAMVSGVLLLLTGLAGPVAADTLPSPSGSPSSSQPGDPPPSPSPSSNGNAPPEFIQCPGVIVHAGAPESIGFQVTDPDGDRVTLRAAGSSVGAQTSIQGHTLTYTAPPAYAGQDFIAVTADDGRGGTAVCDLSIRVEPRPDPTPSPTPTTTPPSATPTQEPTTPAPSPTSSAPAPSQAPTSGPAPTAEPSPAPSTPDTAAPTTPPSGGSDPGSASGTPDATGPGEGSNGGAGGGAGESGGPGNGTEPTPEDGTADPGGSADPATATQRLQDLTHETTVSCSLQAVEDARTLLQGISAGLASRPGSGSFPEAGPGDQDGSATHDPDSGSTPAAASDRTSEVTGSSIWLFSGVGLLMLVLIGLAAAALPRRSRRH